MTLWSGPGEAMSAREARMHQKQALSRRRALMPAAPGETADDIRDLLSSASERTDLERLFDRKVALAQILRLAGKRVDRRRIQELLGSDDPSEDLRKLLGS